MDSLEEDAFVIIDDIDPSSQAGPSTLPTPEPMPVDAGSFYAAPSAGPTDPSTQAPKRNSARLRSSTASSTISVNAPSRVTRLGTGNKLKMQPKLKLKLSEKAAAQAPGMSFLGQYDRELDSDEEDLVFEEHCLLRIPPGEDCDRLKKMVAAREVTNDVWFKFHDSRRAVFHIGNSTYSAKLVDMPCIIESQKTLDNKYMFKVADICQMLVVGDKLDSEEAATGNRGFNIDEFIWPHGITPPLHHVRKRRFRKRINRRTIESVEQQVERLLDEDALATEVKFEILENVNPDLSDSEFIEREDPLDAPTPAISDFGDAATPGGEDEDSSDEDDEADGDIDEELAAELDLALGDEEDADDEEEDESDESEEDEEEDDDDTSMARKLLNEEIRDLEAAVAKKNNEIASSANPLIKKRFEDALKKLSADLEMKLAQREDMKEQQRLKKEGVEMERDSESEGGETEPNAPSFGIDDSQMEVD